MQDAARGIAAISREAGLEVDEEEYLGGFRPSLMDVFYNWSKGKSFAEVGGLALLMPAALLKSSPCNSCSVMALGGRNMSSVEAVTDLA